MPKRTEQRQAIAAVLDQAGRPLRPDEVLAAAVSEVPGLGIATVYRNLKRMHQEGVLRSVELPGEGTTRYEPAELHHHHHFHCEGCDRVFDVNICPGDFAGLAPAGFQIERHELVLYGSCADCRA